MGCKGAVEIPPNQGLWMRVRRAGTTRRSAPECLRPRYRLWLARSDRDAVGDGGYQSLRGWSAVTEGDPRKQDATTAAQSPAAKLSSNVPLPHQIVDKKPYPDPGQRFFFLLSLSPRKQREQC